MKNFSICFFLSLPINSEHQKQPALESSLGAASGPESVARWQICPARWKWGCPSCRLSIPSSKPGQDRTSNKLQLWFHMDRLGRACSSPISRLWSEADSAVLDLHLSYSFHPEWIPKPLTAIQYMYLNIFGCLYTVRCFPNAMVWKFQVQLSSSYIGTSEKIRGDYSKCIFTFNSLS